MNKHLYILLPVHNRKDTTETFVKCLLRQTFQNFKLILIDDGSTDGTSEMVLSYLPDSVIIKGKGKWWWGGSLHQGYKWVKKNVSNVEDIVLIINDDVEFESDFLESGIRFLETHEKTLLLAQARSMQTKELHDTGTKIDWKHFTFRNALEGEEIDCLATRGLFLKVKDFLTIGCFHPIILPHYLSDYEFTIRAKRKRFHLMTTREVWLWMDEEKTGYHKVGGIKQVFSKKSAVNPLYLLCFILLACPWRYKMHAIWKGIVKKMFLYVFKL
ncbi:MAG: glycosyltransferase family 2 protein [Brevinematales bacterium]